MLLLLIRHGLTGQVNARLTGWTPGVGLSTAGRAQAAGLIERLEGVPLDAVYSSPLERAVETATPLARARGLRVVKRKELGEVHYGDLQGKSLKALARTNVWSRLRSWPSNVRFPGGETLRETQARAVTAIEKIRSDHAKATVAVFSHGDFVRLTLAHYLGIHIDLYRRIAIDTASVSAIEFGQDWVQVPRMNDTGTLAQLARVPVARPLSDKAVKGR
ncbi:MAG TPA: MSMEG_4193 family putative phosphomutase [Actinomycetota bacterium]